jgi:hypothetical protein
MCVAANWNSELQFSLSRRPHMVLKFARDGSMEEQRLQHDGFGQNKAHE